MSILNRYHNIFKVPVSNITILLAFSVARCALIGKPKNGFYVKITREGDIIKHGEWINYGCIGGYTLVGNGTQECSDGQWTNPIPACKGMCTD